MHCSEVACVLTRNLTAGPPMTPPDGPLKKRLKK
ncbi:hypothetical protein JMJ77_0012290 [Colletotrichum scovillei]|uniref:Uncharacterized protein n=1 Tax=Colletotrichum scovillei TaxID=1209932 RepID=A0A9P7UBS8_9PEZI|nr:hypothetical protein JMJ78_0001342 [Colletotrichum scovillei]KAG7041772.1 hypothetical protein JMJ77_0012290 [Colletotrichum scovillei]KAG7061801.1 hypothetical protein JMJ76_0003758 [Colletotrichum scovillei]